MGVKKQKRELRRVAAFLERLEKDIDGLFQVIYGKVEDEGVKYSEECAFELHEFFESMRLASEKLSNCGVSLTVDELVKMFYMLWFGEIDGTEGLREYFQSVFDRIDKKPKESEKRGVTAEELAVLEDVLASEMVKERAFLISSYKGHTDTKDLKVADYMGSLDPCGQRRRIEERLAEYVHLANLLYKLCGKEPGGTEYGDTLHTELMDLYGIREDRFAYTKEGVL